MNVASLIEALSDYGDHLPVVVEVDRGESSTYREDITVETTQRHGEPVVTLTVEL